MITIEQWRAAIGRYLPRVGRGKKCKSNKPKEGEVLGALVILSIISASLIMSGDVELNPGPPKPCAKTRQSYFELKNAASPGNSSSTNEIDEKLDTITATLQNEIKDLKRYMDDKWDPVIEELRTALRESEKRITELENMNEKLYKALKEQEDKLDDQEARSRRNNIVIHGIQRKNPKETWDECEELVRDLLEEKLNITNPKIERAHRLGHSTKAPIILRFLSFKEKEEVLRKRASLKGTNIFINEDFTGRVRDIRSRLSPFLRKMREEGKRVNMVYDHLSVDGVRWNYVPETGSIAPAAARPGHVRHYGGSSPSRQTPPP